MTEATGLDKDTVEITEKMNVTGNTNIRDQTIAAPVRHRTTCNKYVKQ